MRFAAAAAVLDVTLKPQKAAKAAPAETTLARR